jgi:hypothetical protein
LYILGRHIFAHGKALQLRTEQEVMTKEWGVLCYLVAQPVVGDDGRDHGAASAQEEIRQLRDAACPGGQLLKDVHVAYQVVFRGDGGKTLREFVQGTPQAAIDVTNKGEILGDRTHFGPLHDFILWARQNVPARRYVLVFWGHAFGPGGILGKLEDLADHVADRIRTGLGVPPPIVKSDTRTFAITEPIVPIQLPALKEALVTDGAVAQGEAPPFDVVLFRNCLMGNVETACELQDVTQFIIGSQSYVPMPADGFSVWPYSAMLSRLDARETTAVAGALLSDLEEFYARGDVSFPNVKVPFSLLRLSRSPDVASAFAAVRNEIMRTGKFDTGDRRACTAAIQAAATGPFHKAPGDFAMIDVVTMCDRLAALTGASPSLHSVAEAVNTLQAAVRQLIVGTTTATSGCTGASVFYHPDQARETAVANDQTCAGFTRVIFPQMHKSTYDPLIFNQSKWADIGFEQTLKQ